MCLQFIPRKDEGNGGWERMGKLMLFTRKTSGLLRSSAEENETKADEMQCQLEDRVLSVPLRHQEWLHNVITEQISQRRRLAAYQREMADLCEILLLEGQRVKDKVYGL